MKLKKVLFVIIFLLKVPWLFSAEPNDEDAEPLPDKTVEISDKVKLKKNWNFEISNKSGWPIQVMISCPTDNNWQTTQKLYNEPNKTKLRIANLHPEKLFYIIISFEGPGLASSTLRKQIIGKLGRKQIYLTVEKKPLNWTTLSAFILRPQKGILRGLLGPFNRTESGLSLSTGKNVQQDDIWDWNPKF